MADSRQLHLFKGSRQRGTAPPPPTEFSLHVLIADTLRRWIVPGWLFTHMPMGELRQPITAARLKRMGVTPGWPDFLLLAPRGQCTECGVYADGGPHFLELKRPKLGRFTDEQKDFAWWCASSNYPYACVDNYPAALDVLKRWGAVRANVSTW